MSTLSNDPASRYWREHFNCEPNPLQRRLLKNARRHLSLSDPFMFFFAFVIHVCTLAYLDDDIEFMTDAAVSRDLAKQMRTDYERRLDQLEFLAERTSDQIRGWESHEERLSIWQIKPEELPTWSMILVNGMFLMILAGALLLVAA